MRAVVLDASGRPKLADLTASEPSLDVLACGLCGSDVEKLGRAPDGTVLGHEVVARGSGRRLALLHHRPCGECPRCRTGHETTCERFAEPTIVPGGFAERVGVADGVELPDALDDVRGTMVEPLACVLRGAARVPSGRVLVVGNGFVGRLFDAVLTRRGDEVFAVDADPRRSRGTPDGRFDAAVVCARGGGADALEASSPAGRWSCSPTRASSRGGRRLPAGAELDVPEPTVLPLARFAEGLDLFLRRDALKVVFVP